MRWPQSWETVMAKTLNADKFRAELAALAEELREMKNSLNREYLLREPHMRGHAALDDRLRALTRRVDEHDRRFSAAVALRSRRP